MRVENNPELRAALHISMVHGVISVLHIYSCGPAHIRHAKTSVHQPAPPRRGRCVVRDSITRPQTKPLKSMTHMHTARPTGARWHPPARQPRVRAPNTSISSRARRPPTRPPPSPTPAQEHARNTPTTNATQRYVLPAAAASDRDTRAAERASRARRTSRPRRQTQ